MKQHHIPFHVVRVMCCHLCKDHVSVSSGLAKLSAHHLCDTHFDFQAVISDFKVSEVNEISYFLVWL